MDGNRSQQGAAGRQEWKETATARNNEDFYGHAIENSGGVPYRLLFGKKPGYGIYVDGEALSDLLGIMLKEFPERVFDRMVEQVILQDNIVRESLAECRLKMMNGELKNYRAELLMRTARGEKKWILDAAVQLTDETTGQVTGIFGIFRDITSVKAGEERIREKEEEYERLKSSLIHNIAHEVRTPLNAIVGFSTLLGEYIDDPERRKECLDIITRNSDHLLAVIDAVVEVSKIDSKMIKLRKERVDLHEALDRIYNQFWPEAFTKGLQITPVPDTDPGYRVACTDYHLLMEIMRNLVGNAVKFTFEGKVEFGYTVEGGKIRFYVSDTGIGIPFEQQPGIFSRFFQGDSSSSRSFGGTGLGLSITRAYVELLGGEIRVNSRPGEGSVFRFAIPYEGAGEDGRL